MRTTRIHHCIHCWEVKYSIPINRPLLCRHCLDMLADDEFQDSASLPSTLTSYGEVITRRIPSTRTSYESSSREESHASSEHVQSPAQHTLDEARDRAVLSICFRAVRNAETVDSTKIGVVQTLSPSTSPDFLSQIASKLHRHFLTASYLFAICPSSSYPGTPSPLLICGSSAELVSHAETLIGSKFVGRLVGRGRTHSSGKRWLALIRDLGTSSYDAAALTATVRQAARTPIDPSQVAVPPPGSLSAAQLLARARARLQRLSPHAAYSELRDAGTQWPVVLVDIRSQGERERDGTIAGALAVERNALEWRFDPRRKEGDRLPIANRYDLRVILFCMDGSASSLAAASLLDLGLLNATDVVGGYMAWKVAGLPAEVEVLATGIPLEVLR